jgi:cellulose synthase/poly-beta-1,6-N-acetylglucosamine synthase-like glycosyltransferase
VHHIRRTPKDQLAHSIFPRGYGCIPRGCRKECGQRQARHGPHLRIYQPEYAPLSSLRESTSTNLGPPRSPVSVTPDAKIGRQKDPAPIQIIFCLKEKHQRKINSHRWVFNAFGPVLKPNICVLLDVGTMPGPTSLYHLWKVFDINSNIGGACGELVVSKRKFIWNLWKNPLVAAQNFEYKMGDIFDRSLESVFGYITVLPGAFSAYR